ncbi:8652_t:CDS:10 [Funneliformis geosporum]|uniref:8652_t:CDS:1 n=1 Tax=Funneliformis geosporum TaxID=1117311 RepID=A0A9W4WIG8_9GLOM|nr:8652_t:CDS:10 [Funneliformis geosporum]
MWRELITEVKSIVKTHFLILEFEISVLKRDRISRNSRQRTKFTPTVRISDFRACIIPRVRQRVASLWYTNTVKLHVPFEVFLEKLQAGLLFHSLTGSSKIYSSSSSFFVPFLTTMSRDSRSEFWKNAETLSQVSHDEVLIEMGVIECESQAGPSTGGGQSLGEFFKEAKMIRNIKENTSGIEDLHKRTLVTVTNDESSRMSRQLDLLISETIRVAGQISNKLAMMEQNNKMVTNVQDQTQIRLAQHATLVKTFIDTMTAYRQMQLDNEKRYKKRIERQYRIVKPDATQQDIDQLISEKTGQTFASQALLTTSVERSRSVLKEIQDRQRDILKIERSINELNKIFSEVQALVIEQQDDPIQSVAEAAEITIVIPEQGRQDKPTVGRLERIRRIKNVFNKFHHFRKNGH